MKYVLSTLMIFTSLDGKKCKRQKPVEKDIFVNLNNCLCGDFIGLLINFNISAVALISSFTEIAVL